jgi:hypothetical protein
MAEVAMSKNLFAGIIAELRPAPGYINRVM